jgi:hypothetical protein
MAAVGTDYLACSAARNKGTCDNPKGIRRSRLEDLVLEGLKERLMEPELVREFIAAFNDELDRRRRDREIAVAAQRRELAEVTRKLDGLIDAIADGLRSDGLQETLQNLERRKADLARAIAAAPARTPRLHPSLAELYRRKVENLKDALNDDTAREEAIEILRTLIEAISVKSTGRGFEVELVGDIVNMLKLPGKGNFSLEGYESSVKVVAEERFRRDFPGLTVQI